jgi:hypothetical protein
MQKEYIALPLRSQTVMSHPKCHKQRTGRLLWYAEQPLIGGLRLSQMPSRAPLPHVTVRWSAVRWSGGPFYSHYNHPYIGLVL